MGGKVLRDRTRSGKSGGSSVAGGKNGKLFYTEPEFIRLYKQYESSAMALKQAVGDECARYTANLNETEPPFPAKKETEKGKMTLDAPALNTPKSGREIDLYRINTLRRFYERDAYRVFTYQAGIMNQLPPDTLRRELKGLSRDFVTAQKFGEDDRAYRYIAQAQKMIDSACAKAWDTYHLWRPEKIAERIPYVNRYLVPILELVQLFSLKSYKAALIEGETTRVLGESNQY